MEAIDMALFSEMVSSLRKYLLRGWKCLNMKGVDGDLAGSYRSDKEGLISSLYISFMACRVSEEAKMTFTQFSKALTEDHIRGDW
jgi:hypothetical protein